MQLSNNLNLMTIDTFNMASSVTINNFNMYTKKLLVAKHVLLGIEFILNLYTNIRFIYLTIWYIILTDNLVNQ